MSLTITFLNFALIDYQGSRQYGRHRLAQPSGRDYDDDYRGGPSEEYYSDYDYNPRRSGKGYRRSSFIDPSMF